MTEAGLQEIEQILEDSRYGPTALANFYRVDAPNLIAEVRKLRDALQKIIDDSHCKKSGCDCQAGNIAYQEAKNALLR